jgi:transcriptional regulator with XRE-family HTH domain
MQMGISWQKKAQAQMARKGILQRDIVENLGVTKGTVSSWFRGRYPPPTEQLKRIAEMLEMTLAELLSEDDALARNSVELSILRHTRRVPAEKLDQAER